LQYAYYPFTNWDAQVEHHLVNLLRPSAVIKHGELENHEPNAGFHGKIMFVFLGFPHLRETHGLSRFPTGDPGVSNFEAGVVTVEQRSFDARLVLGLFDVGVEVWG